jgi:hypothetical protein
VDVVPVAFVVVRIDYDHDYDDDDEPGAEAGVVPLRGIRFPPSDERPRGDREEGTCQGRAQFRSA